MNKRSRIVVAATLVAGVFLPSLSVCASQGTVSGWLKPSKNPAAAVLTNAAGEKRATFGLYRDDWARADVSVQGPKGVQWVNARRNVSNMRQRQDEWIRVVYVWEADGRARFFVNGAPYGVTSTWGDKIPSVKGDLLGDATAFTLAEGLARDFAVEHRAWSAKEVADDWRRACPVDIVMDDALVRADEPGAATWILAPGGRFTRPKIAEGLVETTPTVEVATSVQRITGEKGTVLEPVAGTETPFARYEVTKPIALKTARLAYPEGTYRLAIRLRKADGTEFLRTLFFRSLPRTDLAATPATKEPWKKTRTLFTMSFAARSDFAYESGETKAAQSSAGAYLEAGATSGNRFAAYVTIPEDAIGKPCLVEIEWPDDKPRAMGLYMYEIQDASCRDHLQGGLVTGVEIPNTGASQVRSYLYFPIDTNALFEARTLVTGRPAAVSKFTLSQLAEPLPVLKVNRPKTCRGRTFGHTDEDQTFQNNLSGKRGRGILNAPMDETFASLIRYFGYTGQNAFHYSVLRYLFDYGPVDGCTTLGAWPGEQGAWKGVIREFAANGISFTGQQAMGNSPTFGRRDILDNTQEARGLLLKDTAGKPVTGGFAGGRFRGDNAKKEVRETLCSDFLPTLNHIAEGGGDLTIYLANSIASPTVYPSADAGEQDPAKRAAVVTETTRGLIDGVRRAHPATRINLELAGTDEEYRAHGVDAAALAKIPDVRLLNQRQNTMYYFRLFTGAGMDEADNLDILYHPDAPELRRLAALSEGGSLGTVYTQPVYFETFVTPLGNDKRFQNYFQNADVKPHGRWFLKEPAYCLAKCDMLDYAIGMQPLGTLGNEAETREFVQAYCALPAKPFKTMAGADDPVVGRYLETDEGTYVYLVNYSHVPVTAGIGVPQEARDLSTDATVDLAAVALKPFELRSFLVVDAPRLSPPRGEGASGTVSAGAGDRRGGLCTRGAPAAWRCTVSLPIPSRHCFDARLAEIAAAFAAFDREGVAHATASESVAKGQAALAAGRLAAAHYWLYSCAVNGVMAKFAQFDLVVAEAKRNRSGRWAVNCGSAAFSTVDGRLFSPDRKWDGETYGYFGTARKLCSRDSELVEAGYPLKDLFATESYDVDGYRFKLPKGRYRVKLHVKWGYPRAWKEGDLTMEYWIAGERVKGPFDFYVEQGGDIKKPLVVEKTVDVEDILTIEAKRPVGYTTGDGSFRLFNGIEIERVK